MKVKGKINILDATQSGVSQTTGNPWKRKETVIEVTEGNHTHTMFLSTLNDLCVAELEKCQVGDIVEVDFSVMVKGRSFTRKDGTPGYIRNNELVLHSVTKVEPY